MRVGRQAPALKNLGRIARTRPPGREQTGLAKQALEYDLQDLADKQTVANIISSVTKIIDSGGGEISISLAMPPEYTVAGSPANNGGAFIVTWVPVGSNLGLWGPASGAAAVPTFRQQVNNDLPLRSRIHIEPTTFGGTVNIDASISSQFSLVATSNFTLNAPTGMLDAQKITIRITQDGTGSRLMTYDPLFRFSTYLTPAFCTLTTIPGATDYLGVERNDDAGAFDIIAFVPGVS